MEDPKGIRQIAQERAATRRKKDDYFRWLFAGMRDILLDHLASRKPPITDHGVISPLSPAMQQKAWTREELASMETVLLAVTEPRNVSLPLPQLPITGGVMKITQENKQTTAPSSALEELEVMVQKKIERITEQGREKIRRYYQANEHEMPTIIKMNGSDKISLNHLLEGPEKNYFPQTYKTLSPVEVVGVKNLQEMVCEPIIAPKEAPASEAKNTQDPPAA